MAQPVFLSIIIPAFDEECRIADSLKALFDYLGRRPFTYEVIVVDDGSRDNTVSLVNNFDKDYHLVLRLIENHANRGKGYSVRQGVLMSAGEFVIFTDADLCCPVEEIDKLVGLLQEGNDIVIGSRAVKGANLVIRQPWWREAMGRCFNLLVQAFVLPGIWDTQCGFKGFRGSVAREIFSKALIDRFGFDVEILLFARQKGYKIIEVGVAWRHSSPSKVAALRDSLRMLIELARIKMKFKKENLNTKNFSGIIYKLYIFIIAYILLAALPLFLYLSYRHSLGAYRMMWLNLWGAHYNFFLETPKPLMAFFAGVIGPSYLYLFACLFGALLVVCWAEISLGITGSIWHGVVASFLYFFTSKEVLINFLLPVSWGIFYIPLIWWSVTLLILRRYRPAAAIMFLSGLLRPESWLFGILMLVWFRLRRIPLRPVYWLAAFAPFIWMLFDWRITGNLFASALITKQYGALTGFPITTFTSFWPMLIMITPYLYNPPILLCGSIGLGTYVFQSIRRKHLSDYDIIFILSAATLIGYWLVTIGQNIVIFPRFLVFPYSAIYLFAGLMPAFLSRRYILGYLLLALLFIAARPEKLLINAARKYGNAQSSADAMREAGDFLEGYFKRRPSRGKILCEAGADYLSLRFGEDFSRRIIFFREIGSAAEFDKTQVGLAIYQYWSEMPVHGKFLFLGGGRRVVLNNRYIFTPVFISRNRLAIVYEINRKSF